MDAPRGYQNNSQSASSGSGFSIITIIFVVLGFVGLYYLYKYLYSSVQTSAVVISGGKKRADIPPASMPMIPTPYEGGEYSFNTWLYISSFNKNRNTRKHIFEIKGTYFSTLLVALGAYNNTLVVRTQTNDPTVQGFQSGAGAGTGAGTGAGSPSNAAAAAAAAVAAAAELRRLQGGSPSNTTPPTVADMGKVGNLSAATVTGMFQPLATNDSLVTTPVMCDLPEIDLQRWTMVTVVLSGKTIDVYLDGKLARSCVAHSFYRVDPTGIKGVMAAHGGFDGYTGTTSVANYAMNPDEIYKAYMSGPDGSSMDPTAWFLSLFGA